MPLMRWPVAVAMTALLLLLLSGVAMAARPADVEQSATPTPVAPAADADATPAADDAAAEDAATEEAAAQDDPSADPGLPSVGVAAAGAGTTTSTLADLEDFNGIPVGFTDEGYPFLGDPAASVVMVEWSDYLCPFCGRHFLETKPLLIDEYVLTGKLRMVFRDFPIPSLHPTAQAGHVAARCVGEQGAPAYWAMHDELFGRQNEWNRIPDPAEFLRGVADEVGADLEAYDACLESGTAADVVAADMAEAEARGFTGTPTFTFSGDVFADSYTLVGAYPVDAFRQWIDAMVAGDEPPQEPEPEAPQLPLWAQADNLLVSEDDPQRNVNGDHTLGSDDAPVTFVEFSDFQCPACALHATQVQPTINEEYIETGLVRWVIKHRPLPMHPLAPLGSVAAECASDQGAFWEMHDLLFAEQATWAPNDAAWTADDAEVELLALAKELELDSDVFDTCINGRAALERVLYDIYDAEGIVSSTPTFIVLFNGEGTLVSGSRPVEEFAALIDSVLEVATGAAQE
jgi:protein-disulfide isomerase